MKIGLFSDLHLKKGGKKIKGIWDKKLIDGLSVLEQVCDLFLKENVQLFIFLGDFFEQRYYIDVQIIHGAVEIIQKLKHIRGYFLAGNHDMYMRSEINSLNQFGLRWGVVDDIRCGSYSNTDDELLFIPYKKEFTNEDYKKINEMCKHKILFMHQILRGFNYQNGYTPTGGEVFDYERIQGFRWLFSGHNHVTKYQNNVVQTGSVMQLNFGDEGVDRGCWIYDLESDKAKFYKLSYPTYTTLDSIPEKGVDDYNYYRLKVKESQFSKTFSVPSNIELQIIPEDKVVDRLNLGKEWDWTDVVKKYCEFKEKSDDYIQEGNKLIETL